MTVRGIQKAVDALEVRGHIVVDRSKRHHVYSFTVLANAGSPIDDGQANAGSPIDDGQANAGSAIGEPAFQNRRTAVRPNSLNEPFDNSKAFDNYCRRKIEERLGEKARSISDAYLKDASFVSGSPITAVFASRHKEETFMRSHARPMRLALGEDVQTTCRRAAA